MNQGHDVNFKGAAAAALAALLGAAPAWAGQLSARPSAGVASIELSEPGELPAAPALAPLAAGSAQAQSGFIAAPAAVSFALPGFAAAATPAAEPSPAGERLAEVSQAVASLPELSRVEPGAARGAGAALEDALTRTRSVSAADLSPIPADGGAFSAPLRPSPLSAASGVSAARPAAERALPALKGRLGAALYSKSGIGLGLAATAALLALTLTGAVTLSLPAMAALASLGAILAVGTMTAAPPAPQPDPAFVAQVQDAQRKVQILRDETAKVIVGQREMVDAVIMGLIAGEHVLLEGVPGVAKTQTVKAVSSATDGQFQRIQGTPDQRPSDIIGGEMLVEDPQTNTKFWKFIPGPIFANIVLADELNRMMPKTQSALLEAMQEGQVTVGRTSHPLPKPFFLLATQNHIEEDGTYPLPRAQEDRFMFKVSVGLPNKADLKLIMDRFASKDNQPKASAVMTLPELVAMRAVAEKITLDETLKDYIVELVDATGHSTRKGLDFAPGVIEFGASPRAAIFLGKAARIHALLEGRTWVSPADIRAMAPLILRHRITLGIAAHQLTVDEVIQKILQAVPVPSRG